MSYATDHIAATLKLVRERKGLSQRALGDLVGVPQSHISKIEKGAVDLRLSSLVELARALGLELTLVPHKHLAAVQTIIRDTGPSPATPGPGAARELGRLSTTVNDLARQHPTIAELARLQRQLREIQQLHLSDQDRDGVREINSALKKLADVRDDLEVIRDATSRLQALRNRTIEALPDIGRVTSAYSLEEDDHG